MLPDSRPLHQLADQQQPLLPLSPALTILISFISIVSCAPISERTTTSVKHDHSAAESNLSDKDFDIARLRSLALDGDAEAQYQLAKWYAKSEATGDDVQASHWWQLAAKQGLAKAQYALGIVYANGRGVRTDHARAVHWYRQAADQGLAEAEYNLAMHYWLGQGVPRDEARAVQWLRRAAEKGLPQAQYNLGLLSERDRGATQRPEEARQW